MARSELFGTFARNDASPARYGETIFTFLNRSASRYFAYVREFMEEWLNHVPSAHRTDLIGRLRKGNAQHEAAFWELYLYEGFRRSGFDIVFHPDTGVTTHPDFLMTRGTERFYVEAVTVGRDPSDVAEVARLNQVYEVLAGFEIHDFFLSMFHYRIGAQPLGTRSLRAAIARWLATLDPDDVAAGLVSSDAFSDLPTLMWEVDGWSLEINAMPIKPSARGQTRSALGVIGGGEAMMVDNRTGIRRVLKNKYAKYGQLDAPLVIAIQSNTEHPTAAYDIEAVLFGETARRPTDPDLCLGPFRTAGFWVSERGWRRDRCPTIVSVCDLKPWTVTKVSACVWNSLSPGAAGPLQPPWIASMGLSGDHATEGIVDVAAHFELDTSILNSPADFST